MCVCVWEGGETGKGPHKLFINYRSEKDATHKKAMQAVSIVDWYMKTPYLVGPDKLSDPWTALFRAY